MAEPIAQTPVNGDQEKATHETSKSPHSNDIPTKKQQLIRMLRGKSGVSVEAISAKFGWQAHTTRAALSGLRKAGFEISAEKRSDGKPSRYRISSQSNSKTA